MSDPAVPDPLDRKPLPRPRTKKFVPMKVKFIIGLAVLIAVYLVYGLLTH